MSPSSASRSRPVEPVVVGVVAAMSGFAAVAASGEPTALSSADAVWRFLLGALVPLVSYRARSWSWILVSAVAALGSVGPARLVSAAGLVLAVGAVALGREHRLVGLLAGAAAVQGLLHLDIDRFHGDSSLLAVLAVAPLVWSAYRSTNTRSRRQVHRFGLVLIGVVLVVGGAALAAAAAGYGPTKDGVDQARAGLEAARAGDTEGAVSHLEAARTEFSAAHRWFDSWLSRPALALPVVGQQIRALERAAGASSELSALAARTAAESDIDSLRFQEGTIDVDGIVAMEEPLVEVQTALEISLGELDGSMSPWLFPQVASPITALADELSEAHRGSMLAVEGLRVAPGLLGADGARTYLVLFTTPAEARGSGGFVGAWSELKIDDGHVDLGDTRSSADLEALPDVADRTLSGPPDYLARYARFDPEVHMEDVTLSPDFGSVAEVVADLYPQTGGPELDGVIAIDPYGLASLLEITGPISVDGLDMPLNAENAVNFLLRDQYLMFDTDQEQTDVLRRVAESTFDSLLTASELPGPRELVEVLGPVVDQDRLMVDTFAPEEHDFLAALGIEGAFGSPDGSDFFSLVTQNGGHSKIDTFLRRSLSYEAEYDPATGDLAASVAVTLRNTAPASGLPKALIGNTMGLPRGTNRMYLSFYSPHMLEEATVDGEVLPFEVHQELGWWVYSRYVEVPPGSEVVVGLELRGSLTTGDGYQLRIDQQPLVNDDEVSVDLRLPTGWIAASTADPAGVLDPDGWAALREDGLIEVGIEPS